MTAFAKSATLEKFNGFWTKIAPKRERAGVALNWVDTDFDCHAVPGFTCEHTPMQGS